MRHAQVGVKQNEGMPTDMPMKRRTTEFIQHLFHDTDLEDDPVLEAQAQKHINDALPMIGLVVLYFNSLEKAVDSAICDALTDRSDALGLAVIQGMQYGSKVELFKRLSDTVHQYSVRGEPPLFASLIDRLKEAARLRNLVVHADWNSTDAEGYTYVRVVISARGVKQEYIQLTEDAMEKVLDQIDAVHNQLDDYLLGRDEFRSS